MSAGILFAQLGGSDAGLRGTLVRLPSAMVTLRLGSGVVSPALIAHHLRARANRMASAVSIAAGVWCAEMVCERIPAASGHRR